MKNSPRSKSGSAQRPSFGKSSPQGKPAFGKRPAPRREGASTDGGFDKKPRRFDRDDGRPARAERPDRFERSERPASSFTKKPGFGRSAPASSDDKPYTKRTGPYKPRTGEDRPRRFDRDDDRPARSERPERRERAEAYSKTPSRFGKPDSYKPREGGFDKKPRRFDRDDDRPARSERPERRERSEGFSKAPSRFGKPDSYKPREGGFDKKPRRFDRDDEKPARSSTPRYAKKPDFKKKHDEKRAAPRTPTVVGKKGFQPRRETMNRQGVLLWGLHAVREAWLNADRKVYRLWITESARDSVETMFEQAAQKGLTRPEPILAQKAEIEHFLPHSTVHQGVALEVEPLQEPTLDDFLASDQENDLVIVLDQVTDPHNVGAILRSAAAFGARAVIVTERNAPNTTGTMAKTACGALEHVALIPVVNIARTLTTLKEENYWCVGLAEEGDHDMAASKLTTGRVALVMGAEGDGLRRLTREHCDELARLPTGGVIGSLNVSNAAAVALYEVVRQRTQTES